MKKFRKRLFPKVRFTNFHETFPISKGIWNEWFNIQRTWGGSIIELRIKHYQISLDFRKNWLDDMAIRPESEDSYGRKHNHWSN